MPKKAAATSVTHRDSKEKFISVVEAAYNKAGLSDEEVLRINDTPGLTDLIGDFITKNRQPNQYAAEETASGYVYPDGYEVLPIADQIKAVAEMFGLNPAEALAYAKTLPNLPAGAEGWFAIPRWDKIGKTYNDATEVALAKLDKSRKFCNYRKGELGDKYLRQTQSAMDMWQQLFSEQTGDIIIVAAQFGLRHRGKSVRRARETFSANEFGLGIFATCCMLLTHPKRLQKFEELEFDCGGDEYNWAAAGVWSDSPCFCFHDGRVKLPARRVASVAQRFGCASAFLLGSATT